MQLIMTWLMGQIRGEWGWGWKYQKKPISNNRKVQRLQRRRGREEDEEVEEISGIYEGECQMGKEGLRVYLNEVRRRGMF